MNDLTQFLSQIPLFASFTHRALQQLASDPKIIKLPAQKVLFNEGDLGKHFYVVLDGCLEVVKRYGTADEQILDVLGTGDFFGEISLLNPSLKRTASIVAQESSQLLELTRADFDALLTQQPMMAYEMLRVLSQSLNASNEIRLRDLQEKNGELEQAFEALKVSQAQIIEKEKLDRELQMAHDIQMSILPKALPQVEGFDFGAQLVPARRVAGDMYDFIPLSHTRVGIAIADVTDKGLPSAILMAQTHALLRVEAYLSSSSAETLQAVNRYLLEINTTGLPVTAIFGVLDGTSKEFRYARAGHELPLICTAEGEVTLPEKSMGQPLGFFTEPEIDENTIPLPPGSTFLLFTDGVTEAFHHLDLASMNESLMSEIGACGGEAAQVMCDRVLEVTTSSQEDRDLLDDVTLVAVHRTD
jgi:serine phosphatase RsbU (regulator of sigma subunit)